MENDAPATKPSFIKLFLLILIGFIILSYVLQSSGMNVMDVKETDTMIDKPHQ